MNNVQNLLLDAHDLVMDYSAAQGNGTASASANGTPGAIPVVNNFSRQPLALNHANFQLREREAVAIMGPSGSGKSTLLHVLAGIQKPTGGTVTFQNRNLGELTDAERTKLRRNSFGFVFQSGQLLPELPAVENIALPLMLGGTPYAQATDQAILWLERLGLRALANQRPGEMSGGQMQRMAIARALCVSPRVIFADEPTGALDQRTGHEVMDILMRASYDSGASVVLVTHDPNVARFCNRSVTMRDGQVFDSAAAQVQENRARTAGEERARNSDDHGSQGRRAAEVVGGAR